MAKSTAGQHAERVLVVPAGRSADDQRRELARVGLRFAVVTDGQGVPVELTTFDRVAGVWVVPADTPIDALAADTRTDSLRNEQGLPGVVVVDAETAPGAGEAAGIVGVVPAQLIRNYLSSKERPTREAPSGYLNGGYQALPGRSRGGYRLLQLQCKTCGRVNQRETFFRGVDTCDNGHPLDVDR